MIQSISALDLVIILNLMMPVLFSCPALEAVRDLSMQLEGDLVKYLWGSLAQLKAAASLIETFLKRVE